MLINKDSCIDCGICVSRCPVSAIKEDTTEGIQIDLEVCLECGVCKRWNICPTESFYQQELVYPRTVRHLMSDVLTIAPESGISGRGTEEMKTNEVTGRFKPGFIGIAIEMGRPGIGTRLGDVEKIAQAVISEGVEFEKDNPITTMMADTKTGKFKDELLNERCLSAIIEFGIVEEKAPNVLKIIQDVSTQIETVFSLCIASKARPDGTIPHVKVVEDMGLWISPNGKHNLGLGKPVYKFDSLSE